MGTSMVHNSQIISQKTDKLDLKHNLGEEPLGITICKFH